MLTKYFKPTSFLKIAEYGLNKAVRSQTVLNLAALQVNSYFWTQRTLTPTREWVLKQCQVPTEGTLKPLYATINRLEEENLAQQETLKKLTREIKRLKQSRGKNEVYDSSPASVGV